MSSKTSMTDQRLQYLWEAKRLESFKKWPFKDSDRCSKEKMAEAGFFWVGSKSEPDAAQCFVCNKQLDGWESTDDPWQEHSKHAKKCLFVRLGKSEDQLTLDEVLDVWEEMVINLVEIFCDAKQNKFAIDCENIVNKFQEILKDQ